MPAAVKLIKQILVRGTNWIGDAVMTTPALARLRASFPHARIALLAPPRTTGLFAGSTLVDDLIPYRRSEQGVRAFLRAVAQLRQQRFDLAVLFQNAFEAALLARLAGVPLRVGYAMHGRGWLLTQALPRTWEQRNRHQVYDYLEVVAACERLAGIDAAPTQTSPVASLQFTAEQRGAALTLLQRYGLTSNGPLVILNAGATNSRAKQWPPERFAALGDLLVMSYAARLVLIGAASERASAQAVIERMKRPGALNLAGQTSLPELVGLLAACDLLVSNDTGPAHIAAALGRPTLTLFGPTNEFETAPTGSHAAIIRADGIECARCMYRDCPIDHRCMTRIAAEEVMQQATALLARNSSSAV